VLPQPYASAHKARAPRDWADTHMTATPAPNQCPSEHDSDHLRSHAERLISSLHEQEELAADAGTGSLENLIVDGYAHVLALDVARQRLERRIAHLAESGDPTLASELRKNAMMLRAMTRCCEELREVLSSVRVRAEPGS
jgi:hypothetical protein